MISNSVSENSKQAAKAKKSLKEKGSLLFSKKSSPEVSSISFGDPESVPLELSSWEDGFDFSQHVTEDQRQLGQVPPAGKKGTVGQSDMLFDMMLNHTSCTTML